MKSPRDCKMLVTLPHKHRNLVTNAMFITKTMGRKVKVLKKI